MATEQWESIVDSKARDRLQSVFQTIDVDKSGKISLDEFQHACHKLSITVSQRELDVFVRSSVSGDNELTFSEFCTFYVHQLRATFNQIDVNGSGDIGAQELQQSFERLGFNATEREVHSVLAQVDKDNNQKVDFYEFCNFFCSLPSPDLRLIVEQWASGLSIDTGSDIAPPPLPPASLVIWRALLAGGVAGVVSRTATAPLEKIKILAQTSTSGRVPVVKTFVSIWKQEQLRGLFAGNGANCLRVFPFSALVCLAYANLAKNFPLDSTSSSYNTVWRMGAGAFAGVFATVVTHPMDVVRARLTVQSHSAKTYRGLFHGLREVARHEKLPGLYRGIGPTLLAIAPFMAIQQSSYDVLKYRAMSRDVQPSAALFFVCGSAAGAIAQTAVYPLEVIRRRMQVHSLYVSGSDAGFLQMLRTLSIRELFSGLAATYLKVMPAAAISLLVRDAVLGRLKR